MNYTIQNKKIVLNLSKNVFKPSPHGSKALGNSIKICPKETVLDVGTGTGLLAILAAKLGGKVYATDISKQAITLANKNALKNKVKIITKVGNLFEPFVGKKFDVIIANVPQENLSPKIFKSLPKTVITSIHGGGKGNEILLKILKRSFKFMHSRSRLYVVVYSLSNFQNSLQIVTKLFNAKMINFYSGPVKNFVYADLDWYLKKALAGEIYLYKHGEKYWADLFVFELKLK